MSLAPQSLYPVQLAFGSSDAATDDRAALNMQAGRPPSQEARSSPAAAQRVRPAAARQARRTTGKPPTAPAKANRAPRRLSDGIQLNSKAPRLQREARRASFGADAASSSRRMTAPAPRQSANAAQGRLGERAHFGGTTGDEWEPTSRSGLLVRARAR